MFVNLLLLYIDLLLTLILSAAGLAVMPHVWANLTGALSGPVSAGLQGWLSAALIYISKLF